MPTINIPSALRNYTAQRASVHVPGATVAEALESLAEQYPELRRHIFEESGKLRNFVSVFVGEEDMRYLKRDATPLHENDTISLVPAVAGGV